MTALITSEFYPNYTANFAFLSNLIAKFKPNKIISTSSPSLEYGDSINLLRNRAISKSQKIKASPIKKQSKKVVTTKNTPQVYSLRSKELDTIEGRKKISLANENLKRSAIDLDSPVSPTGYRKYQPLLGNQFQNTTLGKKIYKDKETVSNLVKENEKAWKQTQNRKFKPEVINLPPLPTKRKNGKFKPETINIPPLIRNNKKRQPQSRALIPYSA